MGRALAFQSNPKMRRPRPLIWFLASGGAPEGRGRMARHLAAGAALPADLAGVLSPAPPVATPEPGPCGEGYLAAFEFGQLNAETFAALALRPLRATPWRMLLIAGETQAPGHGELITDAQDPRLRVIACTGAPDCPQALGETRAIARALASRVPAGSKLHVSGCAKGCAHPTPCETVLVTTKQGYDLIENACASAPPRRHLSLTDLPTLFAAKAAYAP